jgi:hypothetical protein
MFIAQILLNAGGMCACSHQENPMPLRCRDALHLRPESQQDRPLHYTDRGAAPSEKPANWRFGSKILQIVSGGYSTMNAAEPIDGSTATPAELRRAGIDALVRALGPVGMARFLQQFDPGHGDYTADRDRISANPTVDDLMGELEQRRQSSRGK